MDQCLITSYKTMKHRFLIFWVLLQQLLCHLHPRTFLLIGELMGDPASTYLLTLRIFFRIKWTNATPKFAICASCLTVKWASFSIMILLMLDLVTGCSWIRGIFEWFLTRTEFCKPPANCGKWHLFVSINNTYLICMLLTLNLNLQQAFI